MNSTVVFAYFKSFEMFHPRTALHRMKYFNATPVCESAGTHTTTARSPGLTAGLPVTACDRISHQKAKHTHQTVRKRITHQNAAILQPRLVFCKWRTVPHEAFSIVAVQSGPPITSFYASEANYAWLTAARPRRRGCRHCVAQWLFMFETKKEKRSMMCTE